MRFVASLAFALLLTVHAAFTAHAAGKGDGCGPASFPVLTEEGAKVGELVLGQTTIRGAIRLFPRPPKDYKGNPQRPRNYPPVQVGEHIPKPMIVYVPYKSRYALYFDDNEKLVIVQDSKSDEKGKKRSEILKRYPGLKETNRNEKASELQGPAAPCVTAMFLLDKDDTVTQVAYAYTCQTKQ